MELRDHFIAIAAPAIGVIRVITHEKLGIAGLLLLMLLLIVAILGPALAPHPPFETQYLPNGQIARLAPPSWSFPLGTNNTGQDVLSQLILGTRLAFIVGLAAAFLSTVIGMNVGLISGYFGGKVDQVLMRLTDVAFGIPFLPFALLFVFLSGPSIFSIILVIGLFSWRGQARVVRSLVLKLKEPPFTTAARASGASDLRIAYVHIAPNVMPLAFLYMALHIGEAVLLESGLSFLGFGDPLQPTWGLMLNTAFRTGALRFAWWWSLPPGFALTIFVTSTYLVTRAYEEVVNPRLRKVD
jgi:peptide/nickel transport system permease protein